MCVSAGVRALSLLYLIAISIVAVVGRVVHGLAVFFCSCCCCPGDVVNVGSTVLLMGSALLCCSKR